MYIREQHDELISRLKEERYKIQVISGPRQVGKSTMVKLVLQNIPIPSMMVSADSVSKEDKSWIGDTWDTTRARMQIGKHEEYLLVIDEVHKIDNWSEEVKKQWDADTFNDINIKVVILGSSRLLIKDGLTESLAGRYELIRMTHWSYTETHEAFGMDVNQYIYFGGYLGGAKLISNEARWRRYIKDSIIARSMSFTILRLEFREIGLMAWLTYIPDAKIIKTRQKKHSPKIIFSFPRKNLEFNTNISIFDSVLDSLVSEKLK